MKPRPTKADPAATVMPKRATDEDGESLASAHSTGGGPRGTS
jgi:hypothetical protein